MLSTGLRWLYSIKLRIWCISLTTTCLLLFSQKYIKDKIKWRFMSIIGLYAVPRVKVKGSIIFVQNFKQLFSRYFTEPINLMYAILYRSWTDETLASNTLLYLISFATLLVFSFLQSRCHPLTKCIKKFLTRALL